MSKAALDNVIQALEGNTELLMKKKMIALGKHYTVMDKDQRPLCSVHLDWGQNMGGALLSSLGGKWLGRRSQYLYEVKDANDQLALEIRKGVGSFKAQFTVVELEGNTNLGIISLKRSLIGGMRAQWLDPSSSQVLMHTKGNVIRRKYVILDPQGNEIAKVRHKIMAIRDVWQIYLNSQSSHLNAMIFATILDFEKEM